MKTKVLRLIPVVFMMTTLFTISTIVSAEEIKYCGELQVKVIVGPGEEPLLSFYLVNVGGHFLIVQAALIPVPTPDFVTVNVWSLSKIVKIRLSLDPISA